MIPIILQPNLANQKGGWVIAKSVDDFVNVTNFNSTVPVNIKTVSRVNTVTDS